MNRQPERSETNAARQARLRERRKELGFKRVTLWLSPEQVDTLESFGGEPWLGTTVKTFLEQAVEECQRQPALWREADSLHTSGMNWEAIARQWNEQGLRTASGAEFRGGNISREVRKWKGE